MATYTCSSAAQPCYELTIDPITLNLRRCTTTVGHAYHLARLAWQPRGGTGGDTSKRLSSWPTRGATQGVGNGVLRLLPDHVRSGRGRVPARDVPPLLPAVAPREPRPLSCRRRWLARRRATGGSARPAFPFGAGASRGEQYGGRPALPPNFSRPLQ